MAVPEFFDLVQPPILKVNSGLPTSFMAVPEFFFDSSATGKKTCQNVRNC
jgi:hypothetical protein